MKQRLTTITTTLTPISTTLPVPGKVFDPHYSTPEHRAWRLAAMKQAGWRCQHPGCTKRAPEHRLFADHVVELKDGGAPFDVANAMVLCGAHHTAKTAKSRAQRHGIQA
jgi:hypothetical protein